MLNKSRVWTGFSLLIIALAGVGAMADPGRGPGSGVMRVFGQLDLTADQQQQLRVTFHEQMAGDLGRLRDGQRELRDELGRLVHDPATEESVIVDAVRAAGRQAEQLAVEQHRLTTALFGILTEAQQEQTRELMAELPQKSRGLGRGSRRAAE